MSDKILSRVCPIDKWGKALVIVTGASRGLGAGICEGVAPLLNSGSIILGMARSKTNLEKTVAKVQEINSDVKMEPVRVDLRNNDIEQFEIILKESLNKLNRNFDRAILIHNAGSLGKTNYIATIDDSKHVQEYFDFNLSSVVLLTTAFLRVVKSSPCKPKVHIINISSLCAVRPMNSWSLYCTAKAARDMFFKVLASEEGEHIDILNYAPGPLDTEMQEEARSATMDTELKNLFQTMKVERKLLEVGTTVKKLIKILQEGKYASGDHVDFYDDT